MVGILEYLEEFNYASILLRLSLAVILGGIVGAERATKRQTAGIRTFAVVCLGAAMAMVTNEYLCVRSGDTIDASRMAAQVISGVGFLGVGTIIVTGKNQVKGLTTAASLWTVATLGLAIGAGFIYGACVGFILIMVAVKVLEKASRYQEKHNRVLEIYMELSPEGGMTEVMEYIKSKEFVIRSMHRDGQNTFKSEDVAVTMELDLGTKKDHNSILVELEHIKGLDYIEEIR
ncbi:MgtC/SapB family protein [Niameybacter massiliensis]|uniref:MgtC/SapB family protein n=1 Tax=Niameybacter massiliensis TaxID=1658108 RepID=UPI0006B44DF0|nr:MgtC/SapB family protein [Niameybacter massiliensis]